MINRHHPIFDAARVSDRLWIGSHPPVPGHRCPDHPAEYGADLRRDGGFGFLALCAEEYQPDAGLFPGVEVHHAPFADDPSGLAPEEWEIAKEAVARTVAAQRAGKRCLVTCMAGRNRSGLVTALALASLEGCPPGVACERVRDARGLAALTNPAFRSFLHRLSSVGAAPKPCELCEAKPITRRYWEDGICWIADCKQCRVPMVVYKRHGVLPSQRAMKHMLSYLSLCALPGRRYVVDDSMNTIPDHYHAHLRPET